MTTADPVASEFIPLDEAVAHCGRPNAATAIRWVKHGCRAPDGRTVRLRAWRVGGRWMTTAAEVLRWLSALEAGAEAAAC